jgi:hypothetical protein
MGLEGGVTWLIAKKKQIFLKKDLTIEHEGYNLPVEAGRI